MLRHIQSLIHDFCDPGIPRNPGTLHPDAKRHSLTFNKRGVIDFVKPICIHCGSRHVHKCGVVIKQVLSSKDPKHRFECQHYLCSDCGNHSSPILTYAVIYDAEKNLWDRIAELEETTNNYLTNSCSQQRFEELLLGLIDELYTHHLNIPVTENAIYSRSDIVELLLRNVVGNRSSEMSANLLNVSGLAERTPSSDTVMIYLGRMRPADIRSDIKRIFDTINDKATELGFYSKETDVPIAVDFHLEPYYGKQRQNTIRVPKDKAAKGTKYAFKYATADVAVDGKRLTIYGQHISPLENKNDIFKEVVNYVRTRTGIKHILADREFFTVNIIRFLDNPEARIPFIIPAIKNKAILKEARKHYHNGQYVFTYLFGGRKGIRITLFTIHNPDHNESKPTSEENPEFYVFATNIPIAPEDHSAEGAQLLNDRNSWLKPSGFRRKDLADAYRYRWGVETDYRVLSDDFNALTTSNKFGIRYLYFFTGIILRNIWEMSKSIFATSMKNLFPHVQLRAKVWKYLVERALDGRHVKNTLRKFQTWLRTLYLAFAEVIDCSS